jgi:hypothetical protein
MLSRSFCPRLISMVYSLRLRLILLFMLVVMVAVGTVALLGSQATADNLLVYSQTIDQQGRDQYIISTLLTAYHQQQSQQALQELTDQLAHSSHQRIILYDHQRRVIADSGRQLIGQVLPESFFSSSTSASHDNHSALLPLSTDSPVLATWIIRSKTGPSRRRNKSLACLQTQSGQCRIRRRQQQTHA